MIPWLQAYLVYRVLLEVFTQILNFRQRRCYAIAAVPPLLSQIVSQEDFSKSQAYQFERMNFEIFHSTFDLVLTIASWVCRLYPVLWEISGKAFGTNEYLQSFAFVCLTSAIDYLHQIPFSLFSDFVIESRHGFNKKTKKLFFVDLLKTLALQLAIGTPVMFVVIWLVRWGGDTFYIYLWIFVVIFTFLFLTIYPNFIAPLFNKFVPLKDGDLRTKINVLASSLKFPLSEVYEMDGSTRTSHSNAYFYGLWWNKRIVIFDTLLGTSHDETLAVLGHELGHWSLNHVGRGIALSFIQIFAMLYVYSWSQNDPSLPASFGFDEVDSVIVGLTLFSLVAAPANTILGLGATLLTRFHEFQADAFACSLGYAEHLKSGLKTLHKQNLGTLVPDPWYAWYNFSHPPLLERLAALEVEGKKQK